MQSQKSKVKSEKFQAGFTLRQIRQAHCEQAQGFTLIEILIVIVLLGILAVAVLSAINPLEQIKKARDAGRKSDAAELLNAYERYYTTFGCYPWEGSDCSSLSTNLNIAPPTFGTGGNSQALIDNNEMKPQFANRDTVTNEELYVTEAVGGLVSVCFEPESQSVRNEGLGPTRNQINAAAASCTDSGSYPDQSCYVCVPQ